METRKVINAVVPRDTHFVLVNVRHESYQYLGVLQYMIILEGSEIDGFDGSVKSLWYENIPVFKTEFLGLQDQIEDRSAGAHAFHWSEVAEMIKDNQIMFDNDIDRRVVMTIIDVTTREASKWQ